MSDLLAIGSGGRARPGGIQLNLTLAVCIQILLDTLSGLFNLGFRGFEPFIEIWLIVAGGKQQDANRRKSEPAHQ